MTQDAFTAGEWAVAAGDRISGGEPHRHMVARFDCGYASASEEAANARLCAAAPDLLRALRDLCDAVRAHDAGFCGEDALDSTLRTASDAIDKATGGAL
jgi:hypothetical protein